MQRRDNSNILDDFVYYSDGTKVKYTDWMPGDPNNGQNSERCVAAKAAANYQWGDYPCNWRFLLVCELSGISKWYRWLTRINGDSHTYRITTSTPKYSQHRKRHTYRIIHVYKHTQTPTHMCLDMNTNFFFILFILLFIYRRCTIFLIPVEYRDISIWIYSIR